MRERERGGEGERGEQLPGSDHAKLHDNNQNDMPMVQFLRNNKAR